MNVKSSGQQRGYNLVEVLIAMALLSVVLLSIVTLFVMGRRNVYSGRQQTQATSVGRDVLEDLSNMSLNDLRTSFGIASTSTLGNVDVDPVRALPEDEYSNAILRTTKDVSLTTDPRGLLESWRDSIVENNKMADGYVALVFMPEKPFPTTAALTPGNATVMKVRVLVRWVEGGRRRQAIFDTAKVQRP